MQQAIEVAEFALNHGRQFVVLMRQGGFQVEGDDGGLWVAGGFDLVVDLVEVVLGLAQQQHGGTVGGIAQGGGGADAATGTGNQNDAALQQVGAGGVVEHGRYLVIA